MNSSLPHVQSRSDHPRMCRERFVVACAAGTPCGSSPRVQGTSLPGRGAWRGTRIIPACAGSFGTCLAAQPHTPDHPRVCRELTILFFSASCLSGSSPRVQGASRLRPKAADQPGIIPACAGSFVGKFARVLSIKDHPRVCRELALIVFDVAPSVGSSPRVQGA